MCWTTLCVHIRWMIKRDVPEVLEIERQSFAEPWDEGDLRAMLTARNTIGMVAEHGEKVVGFMVYSLHEDHLQLERIAVDPEFGRRGVGTQLVEKLRRKLSAHRRSRLECNVPEELLGAQLFLRSMCLKATRIDGPCYHMEVSV